jgi:hypothetical protein
MKKNFIPIVIFLLIAVAVYLIGLDKGWFKKKDTLKEPPTEPVYGGNSQEPPQPTDTPTPEKPEIDIHRWLKKGDRGAEVELLQHKLFGRTKSNLFGSETLAKLRQQYGIDSTSIANINRIYKERHK